MFDGRHNRSRSLAAQCGRSGDGIGVKFDGYGRGLAGLASFELLGFGFPWLLNMLPRVLDFKGFPSDGFEI